MPTILLTGANRGLGLEFVKQYDAEGWHIHACARDPAGATELNALAAKAGGRISVHALDVVDFAAIDALAGPTARYGDRRAAQLCGGGWARAVSRATACRCSSSALRISTNGRRCFVSTPLRR
ncbi:MAG: SDR family NAD(P)-dependent oxidoreductase [Gammaproteobacteria bacterium]|nr:SDR family NAD(P)-dependent oxidoreductase [Gammaproteobacteria bacterium]